MLSLVKYYDCEIIHTYVGIYYNSDGITSVLVKIFSNQLVSTHLSIVYCQ